MGDTDGQDTTQYSQQSFTLNTNNTFAPPSLQHSGLTSNLEGMNPDATQDGSPEGAPVGSEQKQNVDF
jgi:hypothetical protein